MYFELFPLLSELFVAFVSYVDNLKMLFSIFRRKILKVMQGILLMGLVYRQYFGGNLAILR